MTEGKFDLWCLVELFGHTKIAGKCTEQNIAGTNMLRVDVPETTKQPAFTRFFGSAAIYAINPIDEQAARFYADRLEIAPIQSYNIAELVKKQNEILLTQGNVVDKMPEDMVNDPEDDPDPDPDLFDEDMDDEDEDEDVLPHHPVSEPTDDLPW